MGVDYLFVVRHGETKANEDDIDAGPLDYPLTKKGVKEASFIAKTLSKVKINAVYSSPVFRAVETAKILARPARAEGEDPRGLDGGEAQAQVRGEEGKAPHTDDPRGVLRDERGAPGPDSEGHRDDQEGGHRERDAGLPRRRDNGHARGRGRKEGQDGEILRLPSCLRLALDSRGQGQAVPGPVQLPPQDVRPFPETPGASGV